jgi:hypothetical protein
MRLALLALVLVVYLSNGLAWAQEQLDLRIGAGINEQNPAVFAGMGMSWRK